MWRFMAGVVSTALLVIAAWLLLRTKVDLPLFQPTLAPVDAALRFGDILPPPEASELTREQKRFSRFDKDKNGGVSRDEYLTARRKAFAKFDVNGDGKLSFEEYAVKTVVKFSEADKDRTGALTPAEFLTTRVVRKAAKGKCPPPAHLAKLPAVTSEDDPG